MSAIERLDCALETWRCTRALPPEEFEDLRRMLALHGFKWDSQVGDVTTLTPFAVVLPASVGATLARLAEALAAELSAAEQALVAQPRLWPKLGLPRRICRALDHSEPWTPTAARIIRFDFHPTRDGWRISEANSDVPGGFIEASHFTQRMAARTPEAQPAGDPLAALAEALARHATQHRRIALLAAAGYIEDQQIVACVAQALHSRGVEASLARPDQLRWVARCAHVGDRPVDAIYRFYQGEWMTRIRGDAWRLLFRGGLTPVCNPAAAIFGESKRLPLVRASLGVPMATWDALLPPTHPASRVLLRRHHDAVLKPAYGNTGDDVVSRAWAKPAVFRAALTHAMFNPRRWIAQSRFETLPFTTPLGPMHPCLGVYTIDGRASGVYGRLTAGAVIDFAAIDTAILIAQT